MHINRETKRLIPEHDLDTELLVQCCLGEVSESEVTLRFGYHNSYQRIDLNNLFFDDDGYATEDICFYNEAKIQSYRKLKFWVEWHSETSSIECFYQLEYSDNIYLLAFYRTNKHE